MIQLLSGDCRNVLATLDANSIDACVTDPPYGLEFMGKEWDAPWKGDEWQTGAGFSKPGIGERKTAWPSFTGGNDEFGGANPTCATCGGRARGKKKCDCIAPDWRVKGAAPDRMYGRLRQMQDYQRWCESWAGEILRVLKPGAHLLAFGGTRTAHRMTCAIEDAGFEIRDTLMWIYASGFPKSLDVSKAIDRAAGAEREVVRRAVYGDGHVQNSAASIGFGGCEPEADRRTITAPATPDAQRWHGWGTALKPSYESITLARKPLAERTVAANVLRHGTGALNVDACRIGTTRDVPASLSSNKSPNGFGPTTGKGGVASDLDPNIGRWPANVAHDGSPEVEAAFAAFGSSATPNGRPNCAGNVYSKDSAVYGMHGDAPYSGGYLDTGSASRFFYSAKATAADRADSRHPTVKPVELLRWLVRLITPPGGTVLDPFAGSGTTAEAAMLEGCGALLIEQDPAHVADIKHRIRRWSGQDMPLFADATETVVEPPAQLL